MNNILSILPFRRWLNAFLLFIPFSMAMDNIETDKAEIGRCYRKLYRCMIDKDTTGLGVYLIIALYLYI